MKLEAGQERADPSQQSQKPQIWKSRNDLPLDPSEGAWFFQNLDFGLLISGTVRKLISLVLSL